MKSLLLCSLCAGLVFTTGAHADESDPSAASSAAAPATAQVQSLDALLEAPVRTEGDQTLSETELDALHGGETIVSSSQSLTATTSHNTINGNYTAGDVTLSGESLANFEGFGNFAINTGAQVSIQSAMNITINLADEGL